MITPEVTSALLWFTAALLAGTLHSADLWKSVLRSSSLVGVTGILRFAITAALLLAAAVADQLFAATGGWITGYLSTSVYIVTFWRL